MIRFAKGPVSYLYQEKPDKNGKLVKRKCKQVLWGDWIRVIGNAENQLWVKVKYGKRTFLMRKKDLQKERVLEIIFLDVGQGDGCILTEPGSHDDPRIIVIDAGVSSNVSGFLRWRFQDFPETGDIHAAIITHPDQDHYKGFSNIFRNKKLSIGKVYHNGLVERAGDNLLGKVENGFLTEMIVDHLEVQSLLSDEEIRGRKNYPKLLHGAIKANHIGEICALTTEHGTKEDNKTWMPGFAPSDDGPVNIEVLGPVVEPDSNGSPRLRAFGATPTSESMNNGKTKNGHSVLLRLEFNGFRVLFGGDLNTSSENFLMHWYGNNKVVPPPLSAEAAHNTAPIDQSIIDAAKERIGVDLMKACHHGSSDVTEEFLHAANATAFVISSGDAESHVHPRPDLLGLLGKVGRGARPLLLSTELSRSTRETEDKTLGPKLDKLTKQIELEIQKGDSADKTKLKKLRKKRSNIHYDLLKKNVGVYGAINLRTDGEKAVIAIRKESGSQNTRWFYYELGRNEKGVFTPHPKGH